MEDLLNEGSIKTYVDAGLSTCSTLLIMGAVCVKATFYCEFNRMCNE
jgi:hypothetical protein